MQSQDLSRSALELETERQNRIYREAVEQKKRQMRPEEGDKTSLIAEEPIPTAQRSGDLSPGKTEPAELQPDRLRHIPEMRSALIPLDDEAGEGTWSKPFSLPRADIEPWLSYCKGYRQSKLFLETLSAKENGECSVDFAVRALLELKRVDINVILEPRVRIDGQVAYLNLEEEIHADRDPLQIDALIRNADEEHENLLRLATERGRQMGNLLYDALMGEGHVHLIEAWELVHDRKPTVEELHLMLTTGRIGVPEKKRSRAPETVDQPLAEQIVPGPAQEVFRKEALLPPEEPVRPVKSIPAEKRDESASQPVPELKRERADRKRRVLFHALHVAAVCAVLVAYGIWRMAA